MKYPNELGLRNQCNCQRALFLILPPNDVIICNSLLGCRSDGWFLPVSLCNVAVSEKWCWSVGLAVVQSFLSGRTPGVFLSWGIYMLGSDYLNSPRHSSDDRHSWKNYLIPWKFSSWVYLGEIWNVVLWLIFKGYFLMYSLIYYTTYCLYNSYSVLFIYGHVLCCTWNLWISISDVHHNRDLLIILC